MALRTSPIPPLDPHLYTGPERLLYNYGRFGAIVPGTPYGEFARGIYVGTTGNISVIRWDGTTQVFMNVLAGQWFPVLSIGVNSSGTTASNLIWGS